MGAIHQPERPLGIAERHYFASYQRPPKIRQEGSGHFERCDTKQHKSAAGTCSAGWSTRPAASTRAARSRPFVDEFHCLLGRLVHAHASFDFTIGLQLNWLGPHHEVKVHHLLDARKVSFSRRLAALKPLVLDLFEDAGACAREEFTKWFEKAEAMKALRNDDFHGRWGAPGRIVEGKPQLAFVALHWDLTPDRDRCLHLHDPGGIRESGWRTGGAHRRLLPAGKEQARA